MEKLELSYGTEVFVAGGFKISIKQVQEGEDVIIVLDDSEVDGVITQLLDARFEALRLREQDKVGAASGSKS